MISEVQALLLKDLFAPESLQLGSRAQKPARGMDAQTSQKTFLLLHSYFLCVSQTEQHGAGAIRRNQSTSPGGNATIGDCSAKVHAGVLFS